MGKGKTGGQTSFVVGLFLKRRPPLIFLGGENIFLKLKIPVHDFSYKLTNSPLLFGEFYKTLIVLD